MSGATAGDQLGPLVQHWEQRHGRAGVVGPATVVSRLTPLGTAVLVGLAVLTLLAVRSRAPGLGPVVAVAIALLLVAVAQRARLGDVEVEVIPQAVQLPRGSAVPLLLTLHNAGGRRLPPVRLHLLGMNAPDVLLTGLAPGEKVTCTLVLTPTGRGHYVGLPAVLRETGVFGLFYRDRGLRLPLELIVTPIVTELPPAIGAHGPAMSEGPPLPLGRPALQGAEPRGTRQWLPGDERRSVHWRASARTGTLTVRQWDPPASARLGIVVHLGPNGAGPLHPDRPLSTSAAADDLLLDAVASLAVAATRQGSQLSLVHLRPPTPAEGTDPDLSVIERRPHLTAEELLRCLAGVRRCRSEGVLPLVRAAISEIGPGGTLLLGVTIGQGSWSEHDLVAVAAEARRAGCTLQAVVGGSWPAAAEAVVAELGQTVQTRSPEAVLSS